MQVADRLRNNIIKLHDQELQLIQRIQLLKNSRTSFFSDLCSFISQRNILLFGKISTRFIFSVTILLSF